MFSYSFLLDQLPNPSDLHHEISEMFSVDPAKVYVGRLYEDPHGPPATLSCTYINLEDGEFTWRVDIGADETVRGLTERETAAKLCKRFGMRALVSTDELSNQYWRLITATQDRLVTIDLDEFDAYRYVLAKRSRP